MCLYSWNYCTKHLETASVRGVSFRASSESGGASVGTERGKKETPVDCVYVDVSRRELYIQR